MSDADQVDPEHRPEPGEAVDTAWMDAMPTVQLPLNRLLGAGITPQGADDTDELPHVKLVEDDEP